MTKRATMNLLEDDEEEDQTLSTCARYNSRSSVPRSNFEFAVVIVQQVEAGKRWGCSDGKGRRYEKGGIVAIVKGEAHGGLGLRGGLLGVQTQSHIDKIIISKLTYKLGGLLILPPIGIRMEPQLGLYVILGEMLGLRYTTSGIKSHRFIVVIEVRVLDQGVESFEVSRFLSYGSSFHRGFLGFQVSDQGCDAALETLPANMETGEKDALMKKAYNTLILCLRDRVLREVTKETTAAGIWTKLT
ncbi:hypothetical protein Tco_1120425, partial [Tanacetum coccineum]